MGNAQQTALALAVFLRLGLGGQQQQAREGRFASGKQAIGICNSIVEVLLTRAYRDGQKGGLEFW